MPKPKRTRRSNPLSMNQLRIRYGVAFQTLMDFNAQGIDIYDPLAVQARMQEKKPDWILPKIEGQVELPKKTLPPATIEYVQEGEGLTSAIKRLRSAEVDAHRSYVEAAAIDDDRTAGLLKRWHSTLEILRKVEESNPDIQKENANVVTKEELAKTLGTLFKNLRQDLEALPLKISTQGQHKEKDALLKIVKEETDRITDALFVCKML